MLINDAMQSGMPQAVPPTQPAPQAAPQAGGIDPNEEIFKQLGQNAMRIIYDDKASNSLVQMMKDGAQDPISALAHATLAVLDGVKKSVKSIDPKVVYHLSNFVIVWLMQIADIKRLFKVDISMVPQVEQALSDMTQQEGAPPAAPPEQAVPQQPMPPQAMQSMGA